MHTVLSYENQPFSTSDYTIFVAEVASTCNEALLAHHLLSVETSDDVRRYLINHQLEAFRTTFFRQTLFAEFEMIAHEAAEKGEALTADKLSEIFLDLNRKYYGDVVDDNDAVQVEWARIPHFYNSFYVYKYATGISAATALASQILSEGAPAVARYTGGEFAGRILYSWSCENNYFVEQHRTAMPADRPVLNVMSSTDVFFSPSNAWLGNAAAKGHCGDALAANKQASVVLIPGAPHTLLMLPPARHATEGFVRDLLKP